MNKDYETLKEFWNNLASNQKAEPINGKWIDFEKFNTVINTYLHNNDTVLDYGCGTGWGLFELAFSKKIKEGLGIDTSIHAINYANEAARLSELTNIRFEQGDEHHLTNYLNKFDFVLSINTLDVVPDEICESILSHIRASLKDNGYFFVGLNPDFTVDELINMIHMEQDGHYFYKNGVLRANKKTIEQWTNLFKNYFEVKESFKFVVVEQELKYPRVGFVLQKKSTRTNKVNKEFTREDIAMFNETKYEDELLDKDYD